VQPSARCARLYGLESMWGRCAGSSTSDHFAPFRLRFVCTLCAVQRFELKNRKTGTNGATKKAGQIGKSETIVRL